MTDLCAVMKRKCQTCGIPLWIAWLLMGKPWQRRERRLVDAIDCIDVLPFGAGAQG